MVTLKRFGEGTCTWCTEQGEGVEVEFRDGLKGFLCKRDFWTALKVRREREAHGASAVAPAVPKP